MTLCFTPISPPVFRLNIAFEHKVTQYCNTQVYLLKCLLSKYFKLYSQHICVLKPTVIYDIHIETRIHKFGFVAPLTITKFHIDNTWIFSCFNWDTVKRRLICVFLCVFVVSAFDTNMLLLVKDSHRISIITPKI